MEANPYAAPTAELDDVRAWDAQDLEARKASRLKRLGATLLDGVINLVWLAPLMWGAVMAGAVKQGIKPAGPMVGLMLLGGLLLLVIFVVDCVLLHRHGQTIGKRTLDIAVVRTDGSRMGLLRYIFLRTMPVSLLGMVPYVGGLIALVDPLLIFNNERRCLHDLIADTIVVDV